MSLVFQNNVVACLPFTEEQLNPKKTSSLATLGGGKGISLEPLLVWKGTEAGGKTIIGDDDLVFVKSTSITTPWAKERVTIAGCVWEDVIDEKTGKNKLIEFILVPVSEIIAIDRDFQVNEDKEVLKVN
jgi:hypothetical protein